MGKMIIVILNRKAYQLKNRQTTLINVEWSPHGEDEATLENEEKILAKYLPKHGKTNSLAQNLWSKSK